MPSINTLAYKGALDTFERFIAQDDGKLAWGSGAAAPDVLLQRSGAGQLTLTGTIVSGAQATAPTIALGTGYSAGSVTAGSTDSAGSLNWTSTAVGPTNPLATVTFGATHAAAPKSVILFPASANAAASTGRDYVVSSSTTGFVVASQTTDTASAQVWAYQVNF